MRSVLAVLVVACICAAAHATVINVPTDQPTIQAGIDAAVTNDTVLIAAGTFAENIIINKAINLFGSGEALTTIYPDFSDVGTDGAPSFDNSQVIVIASHDVEIAYLTVDGDNPSLSTGVTVNGADLDARNGIIESDGPWNRTYVHHTTVKNIYLRGIYARSGGAGFSIYSNTVSNVAATTSSIAIMAWMASGFISNNTVTLANDAIAANHSRGIHFRNNIVMNSGSGVHSDNNNSQGGGLPDSLIGNTVSNSTANGYGVWVFFPNGVSPVVSNNTVTNCDVGLFAWGGGATVGHTLFVGNTVDGQNRPGSVGAYVTTGAAGWPWLASVNATFMDNRLHNCTDGMVVEAEAGYTTTLSGARNLIYDNFYGLEKQGGGTINAAMPSCWWGDVSGPSNPTTNGLGTGNSIADGIDYSPWWGGDYKTYPPHPWLWGVNSSNGSTIQEGLNYAFTNDHLLVSGGTYAVGPQVVIDKIIWISGAADGLPTIIQPTASTGGSGDAKGWFLVNADAFLRLSHLTLDGSGYEINQAVRCYGEAYIDYVEFKNIVYTPGSYQGIGVVGFGAKPVRVLSSSFTNIGRVGTLFFGSTVQGEFRFCTYIGKGVGDWLDYAVEVGAGAVVDISDNTISSCRGIASVDGSGSAGVLATTFFGAGTRANLTGNKISDCSAGLTAGYDAAESSQILVVDKNEFVGNDYGISTVAAPALKLTVYDNTFSNTVNAEDNTSNSVWDRSTGTPVGNCWSDWVTNAGYPTTYVVPGTAGAVDHYPNTNCASACCTGTTGNVNMLGIVDLADLTSLVSYLTGGGYVLPCPAEANVNAAGIVDLADLTSLVSYLTGGGYVLPNCL